MESALPIKFAHTPMQSTISNPNQHASNHIHTHAAPHPSRLPNGMELARTLDSSSALPELPKLGPTLPQLWISSDNPCENPFLPRTTSAALGSCLVPQPLHPNRICIPSVMFPASEATDSSIFKKLTRNSYDSNCDFGTPPGPPSTFCGKGKAMQQLPSVHTLASHALKPLSNAPADLPHAFMQGSQVSTCNTNKGKRQFSSNHQFCAAGAVNQPLHSQASATNSSNSRCSPFQEPSNEERYAYGDADVQHVVCPLSSRSPTSIATPMLGSETEWNASTPKAICRGIGTRRQRRYTQATPSKFCHICQKSDKATVHAVCSNIHEGLCRKVICKGCCVQYGWDWMSANAAGTAWQCPHCMQTCPNRAQCKTYQKTNIRRKIGAMKRREESRGEAAKAAVATALAKGFTRAGGALGTPQLELGLTAGYALAGDVARRNAMRPNAYAEHAA